LSGTYYRRRSKPLDKANPQRFCKPEELDFRIKRPDFEAYELNRPLPHYSPREQMKSLNILIVAPDADKECLRLIKSVSPKIKVKDGAALAAAEHNGDLSKKPELDSLLAWADILYCLSAPQDVIARAPKLKWIQVISAGVDNWRDTDVWKSNVVITRASGIHATPIGEFVLGLMLLFAKNTTLAFKQMQTRHWRRYETHTLRDKTVGIVGLGPIGAEVARLSKAFGMKVMAIRRSTRQAGKAKNVDLLLPQARMKLMLASSDYVVLCLPLTPETHHIVGEHEFRAMKPTARIINIARGQLIDEEALIRALDEKRIAGAGLDVTYREPLPKTNRLWSFDNVILSPHISGARENYLLHATEVFCENLRRRLTGKKLINVVDRKKGY
jgi:phosphoglycerate dehydrogenase-like enzyme